MKRKIAMGLCALLSAGLLCACGADPTTVDYNGYSYDDLKSENFQYLEAIQGIAEMAQQVGMDAIQSQGQLPDYVITAIENWEATSEECGAYVDYDESSFVLAKSGKTLTTDVTVQFENRDATFEVVYSYWNMEVEGFTINTNYTFGEKMTKAGLNTIISMSVVFMVLILISLIIKAFDIFPYLEKKKKEKEAAAKAAAAPAPVVEAPAPVVEAPAPVVEVPAEPEPQQDDTELIAVIAAAIAASTGTSTSDFVVRSINRR